MAAGPVPSIPEPEAGLDLSIPWPCRWFGHQPMATDPARCYDGCDLTAPAVPS